MPDKEFSNIIKVFSGPEIRVEDLSKTYSKEIENIKRTSQR